jgi:peroxiredoxin family protein
MPADRQATGTPAGPDKLSLIVMSGTFERVHYALVLASAAAAIGRPATLFFTDAALPALGGMSAEQPGWAALTSAAHGTGRAADEAYRARGVAGFEELLSACAALGVRFIACEMGLRTVGLDAAGLRPDLPIELAGVVTLLADASPTGAMMVL